MRVFGLLLAAGTSALLMGCGARSTYPPRASGSPNPPQQVTLDLGDNVTLKMVLIPAGKFIMGDPQKDPMTPWYTPHEVTSPDSGDTIFNMGSPAITLSEA